MISELELKASAILNKEAQNGHTALPDGRLVPMKYLRKCIYVMIVIFTLQPILSYAEVRIIDADTIELYGAKIRLEGIDAPEQSQTCENQQAVIYNCGRHATGALKELIASMPNKTIKCDYTDQDKYGRLVGSCMIGTTNINGWLVENGWALAYRQYSKEYVENEKIAN